ncbi:MAG: hypothetical protein SFU85_01375 [Candidatus Methylacidiphilales bacterium]|nr:hypothetical protein [Candidatus Methylacidiphilales bacterium]
MKRPILLAFGFLCILPFALQADEILLKNGQKSTGLITGTDGKSVTLRMTIGGGEAEIPYPLAQVERVQFANDAGQQILLASDDPGRLAEVTAIWDKRRAFLALADSDAGAWALRCARLMLGKKTKKAAAEAVELCRLVEKEDWDAARKADAARLRLTAMAASGQIDEAIKEAESLQDASGVDEQTLAGARIKARFLQAQLSWNKLLELEKDWPKWELMADKRRERTRLLNEALDGFLFPVVFQSNLVNSCAEGLFRAAEIEAHDGHPERALLALDEILRYFPDPEFRGKAEQLKKELEKQNKPTAEKKS